MQPSSAAALEFVSVVAYISHAEERLILRALERSRGNKSLEDLKELLKVEQAALWRVHVPGAEGILVTQVYTYGSTGVRELFLWLLSGKGFWKHTSAIFEQIMILAKVMECKQIRTHAIPSLARVLRARTSFQQTHEILISEVS